MGTLQNAIFSKSNPSVAGQQDLNSLVPNNGQQKDDEIEKNEGFIGVVEVFIHQARDLHDICIYHKQDVYAKLFLTSDPEASESTRTVNGGGQNPVFNENLRINVRTGDCSLRCEIWMLSRVKNYLEDQLLGFALIPLSEILVENGNLEKEFELSTSELLHSPSGFVKLRITYIGSPPDVLEISTSAHCLCNQDSHEHNQNQVPCELEKIEFPDPILMKENEIMVSEYYSNKCAEIESQSLINSQPIENLEIASSANAEISPSNSSESLEKKEEKSQSFVDSSRIELEQSVVQQEIVDMYLKSMKQFSEALAKMKLPIDKGNESIDSVAKDSRESDRKGSKGQSPKVFYGSRAFF